MQFIDFRALKACSNVGILITFFSLSVAASPQQGLQNLTGPNIDSPHASLDKLNDKPLAEDNTQKNWQGALSENGTIMVMGIAAYHIGGSSMEQDFDYEIEGDPASYLINRLSDKDYWKLDDNSVGMNWGHAYAGMIYYQAFRNNNFNYYESTLATLITSTLWESTVEYKEVISINDQVMTTWGGAVLGENFFQLSEMLATKQGWIPKTFEYLFNPANAIRGYFGYANTPRFSRQSTLDHFSVYTGVLSASNNKRSLDVTSAVFGLNAMVDSRAGHYDSLSLTPTLAEFNAEMSVSNEGLEDFQLTSTLLLGGWYKAPRSRAHTQQAWQSTYYLGPSVGMEFSSLGADSYNEDFFATANILGIASGAKWAKNEISFKMDISAYGDFAMVKPFASQGIENYRDFFWNSKSALWENGYAYALGHTLRLKLAAKYRRLSVSLLLSAQAWDSIDNKKIERFGDWNPNVKDLDFKDKRERLKLSINYQFNKRASLKLIYETFKRDGEFIGIDQPDFYASADDTETRNAVVFSYEY